MHAVAYAIQIKAIAIQPYATGCMGDTLMRHH